MWLPAWLSLHWPILLLCHIGIMLIAAYIAHYIIGGMGSVNEPFIVGFSVIFWEVALIILIFVGIAFGSYCLVGIIGEGIDELMWLITRKKVDQNKNGTLYKGYHPRWCDGGNKGESRGTYAVLHVRDSTGNHRIKINPAHRIDTVDKALAWSYSAADYDNVERV